MIFKLNAVYIGSEIRNNKAGVPYTLALVCQGADTLSSKADFDLAELKLYEEYIFSVERNKYGNFTFISAEPVKGETVG